MLVHAVMRDGARQLRDCNARLCLLLSLMINNVVHGQLDIENRSIPRGVSNVVMKDATTCLLVVIYWKCGVACRGGG